MAPALVASVALAPLITLLGASRPADRALRLLFLAHVVDDDDLAQELHLEADDLMRPSRRSRGQPPTAGPWLFAR